MEGDIDNLSVRPGQVQLAISLTTSLIVSPISFFIEYEDILLLHQH